MGNLSTLATLRIALKCNSQCSACVMQMIGGPHYFVIELLQIVSQCIE